MSYIPADYRQYISFSPPVRVSHTLLFFTNKLSLSASVSEESFTMLSDHGDDDLNDDDLDATHNSGNAGSQNEKSAHELPDIPFCGCLSIRFYQPYFDVDTADVISRITQAVFYCRREENFLAYMKDKPDAYGPVWIATTLVFSVAVTSHINSWLLSWLSNKAWYVVP